MKKIISLLIVGVLFVSSSFAYVPSSSLRTKIQNGSEAMMELISHKTVEYGNRVLRTLEFLGNKYRNNDRASYILDALSTEIAPFMSCVSIG